MTLNKGENMKKYKVGDKVLLTTLCGRKEVKIELIKGDGFTYSYGGKLGTACFGSIIETPKQSIFIPKVGDFFYYITSTGGIGQESHYTGGYTSYDKIFSIGNCFKTEEDAEFHVFKLKMEQKMRIAFKDYPCGWGADDKFFIFYSDVCGVSIGEHMCHITHPGVIYCGKYDVVREFLIENREDLIKYFEGV